MQTLNTLINNTTPNKTQTNHTKSSNSHENSDDSFLSMIINSINENISQDSSKEVANQQIKKFKIEKNLKSNPDKIEVSQNSSNSLRSNLDEIKVDLDKSSISILENDDFMQILSLIETLNSGKKLNKFPNFSNTLTKFLSIEKNINEIKGAKNLQDIINLSNKFGLGLSNLKITKEDLATLKNTFKDLETKGFFNIQDGISHAIKSSKNIQNTQIVLHEVTKQKIETSLNIGKKSDEPTSNLTKLLQNTQTTGDKSSKKISIIPEANNNIKNTTNLKNIDKSKILVEQTEQKNSVNSVKNIETDKDTNNLNTTTPISQKSTKDTNINDYLANIMQRAIKESSQAKDKEPQPTLSSDTTKGIKNSDEKDSMPHNSDQNSNQTNSNHSVKDMVANSKFQLKNSQIKHTFESFASNLQEKIAEYKPPITRFHMTLNPTNLGEVEVTLINRGNNLHINFNSNSQTMQLFILHQSEFKNSLVNMGFTELSMNFSDQNRNKDQGQNAKFKNHNSKFENELNNNEDEKVILEVVLPRYF